MNLNPIALLSPSVLACWAKNRPVRQQPGFDLCQTTMTGLMKFFSGNHGAFKKSSEKAAG
jgi:hypothetical protein